MKNKVFIYISFLLVIFLFSCRSEETTKTVKIQYVPWADSAERGDCNTSVYNIENINIIRNKKIISCIEKGKRRWFTGNAPKTSPEEGTYLLYIYDDNKCIEEYEVCSDNYLFDNNKARYIKVPEILNMVRAEFYLKILMTPVHDES